MERILLITAQTAPTKKPMQGQITAVITVMSRIIMTKISTVITAMRPITSRDKKTFLNIIPVFGHFARDCFANVSVNRNSAEI